MEINDLREFDPISSEARPVQSLRHGLKKFWSYLVKFTHIWSNSVKFFGATPLKDACATIPDFKERRAERITHH
jgi:hypothetical protein